ncbi:MAG: hypothetical protein M3O46_08675, partial [Myxococcota bacterium]|nr:hypothetical protein [Myxococcota bacterium]
GGSGSSSGSSGAADAGDGGGEGGAEAGAVSCQTYCAAIMASCTGANAQYGSVPECTNACNLLPQGAASDTTGNTVGCRIYHAGLAVTMPSPHCWHAGPYGYGVCGGQCESFCTLATGWCSAASGFDGGAPPYASLADCTTACGGYATVSSSDGGPVAVDGGYTATGPAAGNTLDCREYHLGAALTGSGATMQQLHCPHVAMTSATCH